MSSAAVVGVDIGTPTSKGAVVGLGGTMRTTIREHSVDRPGPRMVEMHAGLWCEELV